MCIGNSDEHGYLCFEIDGCFFALKPLLLSRGNVGKRQAGLIPDPQANLYSDKADNDYEISYENSGINSNSSCKWNFPRKTKCGNLQLIAPDMGVNYVGKLGMSFSMQ